MPIYQYRCRECGHEVEEYQSIHDEALTRCPSCEAEAYGRVPTVPHTDMAEFHKPIEMHSIGLCHPDDIREFKRRHPDVQMSDDPSHPLYGVPVARSRKEKLAVLKAEGFEEKN